MLTRNDKCYFALAFYRQTVGEVFRCSNESECEHLIRQATYWWELYLERRRESRL